MRIGPAATVLLMFTCVGSASASSNVPSQGFIFDNAETVLSGVNVFSGGLKQVTAKLGRPTRVTRFRRTEFTSGGHNYEWDIESLRLRITTLDRSSVEAVEVWGPKPVGETGTTGRGLQLGDTMTDVRRIYGSRFGYGSRLGKNISRAGTERVTIGWRTAELDVYFSKTGNVDHIALKKRPLPWD